MRDYLRATDLQPLPEDIVQAYDDGSAAAGKVLRFGDRLASSPAAQ
jgi:hypothetical protein